MSECHSESKLDLPSVKEHPSYLTFVLEKYQKGTLFHEPQAKTNMNGIRPEHPETILQLIIQERDITAVFQ